MSVSRVEYDAALKRVRELQAAIRSARAICVEAADMGCECHGSYYRCNNCPDRIANRAQDAVEVFERLDVTLAALGLDEPPTETTEARGDASVISGEAASIVPPKLATLVERLDQKAQAVAPPPELPKACPTCSGSAIDGGTREGER